MVIRLEQLLKKIPADTEERVKRTRDRINNAVREAMRRETGLLLNRRESKQQSSQQQDMVTVPVRLKPGIPASLSDMEFEDDHWLAVMVSPYKGALNQSRIGLDGVRLLLDELLEDQRGRNRVNSREINLPPVCDLVVDLLALVDRDDPVKRIMAVNDDILGRYIYPTREELFSRDRFNSLIELYWGIIGLVAGMLGVTIESLTAVVLVHEIAHAYTHLGADIDGERWDSNGFFCSDHPLKEGLAQYYTDLVTERLDRLVPDSYRTYKQLLEKQPDAYRTHLDWIGFFSPEEVRFALLETRREQVGRCESFMYALKSAQQKLQK